MSTHLGGGPRGNAGDVPNDGWLIYKACRGWYRPNAAGYTMNPAEAGRYSYREALSYSHPNGLAGPRDGMTIRHESAVPGAIASARIMGDKDRENPVERPHPALKPGDDVVGDLLEALDRITDHETDSPCMNAPEAMERTLEEIRQIARDAIAKAGKAA